MTQLYVNSGCLAVLATCSFIEINSLRSGVSDGKMKSYSNIKANLLLILASTVMITV
jgi:hypothetical protein